MDDDDVFLDDDDVCGGNVAEEETAQFLAERRKKNRTIIGDFIGGRKRFKKPVVLPGFFGSLLTWALYQQLERDGWTISRVLGYEKSEAVYRDVYSSPSDKQNLVINGQLLLEKDGIRLVVTIDMDLRWRAGIQVEGRQRYHKVIEQFTESIEKITQDENFYIGKKLEFDGDLRFMEIKEHSWDSIILPEAIKSDIKVNTVDFLEKRECWSKYGIPLKRGVLIAGKPGTGKTLICKALLASARDITCIAASPYMLERPAFICELYVAAEKLKPSIVFIEDIDLIAQRRQDYGYDRGPALLTLLSMLDGVEEQSEVVTVATTNHADMLDAAIRNRPSRFDRTITLPLPDLAQRYELVTRISKDIPLSQRCQDLIARETEGCTPAVVEGVMRNLLVENHGRMTELGLTELDVSQFEVETAVQKTAGTQRRGIGYMLGSHVENEPLPLGDWSRNSDWQSPETEQRDLILSA